MGKKIISNLYVMATILFVVGGLLIFQGEDSGSIIISVGLLMNVVYRLIHLNKDNIKALRMLEILKLCSAAFLAYTAVWSFINFEAFMYVIVAIVFDVILNIDDIVKGKSLSRKN